MTETIPHVDLDTIKTIIPHRHPLLLLDEVIDLVPHKSATGIKHVTPDEPVLAGHFPGCPIYPGVYIVEALAQTASVMVGLSLELAGKNALVYFMSIDKCRFRRKVVPGDTLHLEIVALRGGGKVWKLQGIARVGTEIACEAEIMAMIDVPKPAPSEAEPA